MGKLILKDQSEIKIENGSSLSDIRVVSETKYDMLSKWDRLAEDNLKVVHIKDADGTVKGNYKDLILDNETSTIQKDGTILTSFKLREKTEVELLRERVEMLENGQEVQDGAIDDLGAITSALAETKEGGLV